MKREHRSTGHSLRKQKKYEKGYYKTHACNDSFTCKVCDRLIVPGGAGSDHRNYETYVLPAVPIGTY